MQRDKNGRAQHDVISVTLILCTGVASGWGLFGESVYRDNLLVRLAWYGNDLVTLLLALPLLTIAFLLARKRSPLGILLWLGMLAYTFYNYAFYVFGAAFNKLFLAYVLILVLATLGLIRGLTSPDFKAILHSIAIGRAQRAVGIFIIVVSLILGIFWIMNSAIFIWTDQVPAMVTAVEHPTNITAALDLWLVVPSGLLAGTWLWQRRAWGYAIATIWVVESSVYMTALSAATIVGHVSGVTDDIAQLGLWVPVGVGSIISSIVLLRSLPKGPCQ